MRKDGRWGVVNRDFRVLETVYTVSGVESGSSCVFRVCAENSVGRGECSEESEEVVVVKEVSLKMDIVEGLKDVEGREGEIVELRIVVKGGDGKEIVKWYRDRGSGGEEIRDGGSYEGRVGRLRFELGEDVEGEYCAVVVNKVMKVSSRCSVMLREELRLVVEEDGDGELDGVGDGVFKMRVGVGGVFGFRVRVFGYPLPEVKVMRNDVEVVEGVEICSGRVVRVRKVNVNVGDGGCYTVLGGNRFGKREVSVRVAVIDTSKTKAERPGAPEPPFSITPVQDSASLHLRWNPPLSDGGSELIKYSVESRTRQTNWAKLADVNSDTLLFTVYNINESVMYTFRVVAENKVGKSDALVSDSVNITELRKSRLPPPEPPFEITGMTNTSFTLRWGEAKGADVVGYLVEKREEGKKAWQKCGECVSEGAVSLEVCGLKGGVCYHFRVCSVGRGGECSEFIMVQEEVIAVGKRITPPSPPQNFMVLAVTSRSVTVQWSPPKSTGGGELTGYILEKRLEDRSLWEKVVTLETSVTQYQISNLKEKSIYHFRVFAENAVGVSQPCVSNKVVLKTHATPPSPPTGPLECRQIGLNTVLIEWGIPESDGGAVIEGYVIAIKDVSKTMWMEVGQVSADDQKLTVKELQDGHEYLIRIFARNEIGLSEALESEEGVKINNSKLDPSALSEVRQGHDDEVTTEKETPSLSLTTETTTSWMREAGMDADIRFYSRSALLRRNEYFFRIWHYAKELFK